VRWQPRDIIYRSTDRAYHPTFGDKITSWSIVSSLVLGQTKQ
jgi:hypothetical protein